MTPGNTNALSDIEGLLVGHATDQHLKTGVTVVTADRPFVAAVDIMGGAPGTRETDLLAPENTVEQIDALVLSGGSAFGLDAAGGVADELAGIGRGYAVGPVRVPIVPAAIIFDLLGGGSLPEQLPSASSAGSNPYRLLGSQAFLASKKLFAQGSVGAGTGATTADLKGGLGSASLVLDNGVTVAALMVVNAFGSAVVPGSGHFWAAPFEYDNEYGGVGLPECLPEPTVPVSKKQSAWQASRPAGANTTIGLVATDATLNKAQAKRLAVAAQDGMARALVPSHTPLDGDLVFALSTAEKPLASGEDIAMLGHAGAVCVARSIARAVYQALPQPGDILPVWQSRWPERSSRR